MTPIYRRLLSVGLCAALPQTADELPKESEILTRVRIHMAQTLSRLPNYTCVQNIERTVRRAPSRKQELIDFVRLEVALVEGKELFSWPGEGKFRDTDITEMVTGGAIGNGSFALHAKSVFQSGAPTFQYAGERLRDGQHTFQWDYTVAVHRSGYRIRVGPTEAIVGYHGSFWVDTQTLDLVRIEVMPITFPQVFSSVRLRTRSSTNVCSSEPRSSSCR